MRNNRVVIVAALIGVAIVIVTFIGAARMSGDEKGDNKEGPKVIANVKNGSRGVVVFGTVDIDNGAGLLPVFPECFPQPCKVKKVHVVEGKDVELGETLVEFDTELIDEKLAEAQQGLEKAKGALQGAQALLDQAIRSDQGHALSIEAQGMILKSKEAELAAAKIELDDKNKKAAMINAAMDPELLAAEKKYEAAQKALEAEKKRLEGLRIFNPLQQLVSKPRAEAAVIEAKAAVGVQEAVLKQAEYAKKLMTLKAPAAGRIVRTSVTEGMTFGAQTRQPPFMIQTKGPIIVRAEVDQEFASRVAKGQDAVIIDDGNRDLKWSGKVIRVADSFLPKRSNMTPEGLVLNDSRVLECIVSIDTASSGVPVRVGQRVQVRIGMD